MLITLARKPLGASVVDSCLSLGTGAINLDASRIQAEDAPAGRTRNKGWNNPCGLWLWTRTAPLPWQAGRYPSNLILASGQDVGPASRFYLRLAD